MTETVMVPVGAPKGKCPHGRDRKHDCPACQLAGARRARQALTARLVTAGDSIEQALTLISTAWTAFEELTGPLADPGLDDTGDREDAISRLAQASAGLRDVARIIENRQLRAQALGFEDPR